MSIVKLRAALENALDSMIGIIPSVVITSSTAGTIVSFLTAIPHLLSTGLIITISGHSASTPDLNGSYYVVVTGANTFTLQHTVTKAAIASTISGTGGIVKANLTAWEGMAFVPLAGVGYQQVNLLSAKPENPTYGGNHHRELGFMQITLCYPNQRGSKAVMTRAELIRSIFYRGASFSYSGVTVNIPKTPEILPGMIRDENLVVPVRIYYWADIFS